MKLSINPMPALKAARKEAVNRAFNQIAAETAHLDRAYATKRELAKTQDDGLKPEADLRGISVAELSEMILSKPDTTIDRELRRQKVMLRIDNAKTPADLEAIVGEFQ